MGHFVHDQVDDRPTPAAAMFAELGLKRLGPEAFAKDSEALLSGDWAASKIALRLGQSLRDLPVADVDALAAALPKLEGDLLKAVAEDLRSQKDVPIEKALPETLGRLWTAAAKDAVAARLKQIVEQAKARRG